MVFAEHFLNFLNKKKISFFTGVPDSVLKLFTLPLEKLSKFKHIIATNEGSAISLAIGYYLSTKKIAAVYLQNSGLGNAINPLVSIAHREVYSIPMLLIIGWRGSPNQQDEPQHKAKGKITLKLLDLLKIKKCIIRNQKDLSKLSKLISYARKNNVPVACLFEKNVIISKKKIKIKKGNNGNLFRNYVLEKILINLKKNTKIISTTGYTTRELFQIRKNKKIRNSKDFYMVGGMGHSAMVSLGAALHSKEEILCLDGDGSILMHLGSLSLAGHLGSKNFKHIVLNNGSHESVGGQSTIAKKIDFKKLSSSFGYKNFYIADKKANFESILNFFLKSNGPSLFEIRIKNGAMKNLLRPKELIKLKNNFLK